jgi:hypothetical protein
VQNENSQEGSGLRDELRNDTGRVTSAAAERLQSEADSRKGEVAGQARKVSSALDTAARELGTDAPSWIKSALEQGARSIEQAAQAVEGKDSRQLVGDLQQFARQRPGGFLAGCALLGFAASRVFKAGATQGAQGLTNASQPPQAGQPSPAYDPYDLGGVGQARPMMNFSDGGGAATPVSPQNVGTSL